jgi:hypothetical protein
MLQYVDVDAAHGATYVFPLFAAFLTTSAWLLLLAAKLEGDVDLSWTATGACALPGVAAGCRYAFGAALSRRVFLVIPLVRDRRCPSACSSAVIASIAPA